MQFLTPCLPISVFPVPGGPNNNNPLGGPRSPLNISLEKEHGHFKNSHIRT